MAASHLTRTALAAALHCLTACAIGEVHGGAHHAVDPAAVADDPRIASAGMPPGHPHH